MAVNSDAKIRVTVTRITEIGQTFDDILSDALDAYLDVLDPVHIDGIDLNVLPLVKIKLHDVEVDGLADMVRVGDVRLLKSAGERILQVQLEAPRVFYTAKSQLILPVKKLTRTLFGHADAVRAYLEVSYNTETREVSLKQFHISKLTNLHLRYEGAPIGIQQVENILLKVLTRYFSGVVRFATEKTFSHRLGHIFSSSEFLRELMGSL